MIETPPRTMSLARARAVIEMDGEVARCITHEDAWTEMVAEATAVIKIAEKQARAAARASSPLRSVIVREDA